MSTRLDSIEEKELFTYFQYVRLCVAKNLNDKGIENSKKINESNVTIDSLARNFGRFLDRSINNYDRKYYVINENINKFENKNNEIITDSSAENLCITLFNNDKNGLHKLLFTITIIFDNEYEYEYENEGLIGVSNILFNNPNEILTIKKQLEENYKFIAKKGLSNVQKGLLIGASITALVGCFALPILSVGGISASAAVTTHALGFAGDMQLGVGLLSLGSIALSALFIGGSYLCMDSYNKKLARDEFRKLSPELNSLYLAIQCTYIQRIIDNVSEDELKQQLDSIIKKFNELKQDLDFYLFVEKEEIENNKQKLNSFHNFDDRLAKILGF